MMLIITLAEFCNMNLEVLQDLCHVIFHYLWQCLPPGLRTFQLILLTAILVPFSATCSTWTTLGYIFSAYTKGLLWGRLQPLFAPALFPPFKQEIQGECWFNLAHILVSQHKKLSYCCFNIGNAHILGSISPSSADKAHDLNDDILIHIQVFSS